MNSALCASVAEVAVVSGHHMLIVGTRQVTVCCCG